MEGGKLLQYNYWSGWSGLEDREENYSLVTYRLEPGGEGTTLHLIQEGFANKEVHAHAVEGWEMVLNNLKALLEQR